MKNHFLSKRRELSSKNRALEEFLGNQELSLIKNTSERAKYMIIWRISRKRNEIVGLTIPSCIHLNCSARCKTIPMICELFLSFLSCQYYQAIGMFGRGLFAFTEEIPDLVLQI